MSIKVFYCYAHEDKALRATLEKHLGNLKRQELITGWSDRNIDAGKEWAKEIDSNLNAANIILLLITLGSVIFRSVLEIQPQADHKWLVKRPVSIRYAAAPRRVE